jgi:NAD(P)H-hydrate epimerase
MENAGTAVADFILERHVERYPIGVVCGRGNNGGDGFVAARKLYEAGREAKVLLLGSPDELKGDAAAMFRRLPQPAITAGNEAELDSEAARGVWAAPVVVDALLGTGFRPPVTGLYAAAIARINSVSGRHVYAVDLPSGTDADLRDFDASSVVLASSIITFTAPKPAHVLAPLLAEIVVAPIGTPDDAIESKLNLEVITARDAARGIAARRQDSHKGDYGHVLVLGGSVGKGGAAAMTAMAALRAGAGRVTVATPRSVLATVAGFAPEIMTYPLEETDAGTASRRALEQKSFYDLMKSVSVLALGPGLGQHPDTTSLVEEMVSSFDAPLVLDADGLNAFGGSKVKRLSGRKRPLILTPHPGEMARITGLSTTNVQQDRIETARSFAAPRSALVVLKGHRTVVAEPSGRGWINMTGNPGMATAGMGDVLTGLIAGLVAQSPKSFTEATIAAVYLHGLAADLAAEERGLHSLAATDLLGPLPLAFKLITESPRANIITIKRNTEYN